MHGCMHAGTSSKRRCPQTHSSTRARARTPRRACNNFDRRRCLNSYAATNISLRSHTRTHPKPENGLSVSRTRADMKIRCGPSDLEDGVGG
eukprot:6212244-Pleurochrysis_carterae.AAC.2